MDSVGQSSTSSNTDSCCDDEDVLNWFPDELKHILREEGFEGEDIPVLSLIDVETTVIKRDLKDSRDIGLSLIKDGQRPIFVCFTTKSYIYYFHASDAKQMGFVDRQLKKKGLRFYVVNGPMDSRSLKRFLNIQLINQTDLVCLDLHLTVKRDLANQNVNNSFSLVFLKDHIRPKQLSYEELLIKYFPHYRAQRLDLSYSRSDIERIKNSPDSQLAKNVIKKRAALVRVLAIMMLREYDRPKEVLSQQIFSLAKTTDEQREEFDRQFTSDKGSIYYSHLGAFLNKC